MLNGYGCEKVELTDEARFILTEPRKQPATRQPGLSPKPFKTVGVLGRCVGVILLRKSGTAKIANKPPTGLFGTFIVGIFALQTLAIADQFVPYTDGRAGGCWNNGSILYGCTPQPQPATEPDVVYVPTRDPLSDAELRRQQNENAALRKQIQDERALQERARQQQDAEQEAAWAASPAGREAYLRALQAETERREAEFAAAASADAAASRRHAEDLKKPRSAAKAKATSPADCAKAAGIYTCENTYCLCK